MLVISITFTAIFLHSCVPLFLCLDCCCNPEDDLDTPEDDVEIGTNVGVPDDLRSGPGFYSWPSRWAGDYNTQNSQHPNPEARGRGGESYPGEGDPHAERYPGNSAETPESPPPSYAEVMRGTRRASEEEQEERERMERRRKEEGK